MISRRTPHYDLRKPEDHRRAIRSLMWDDHGFLRICWTNLRPVGAGMWRGNQPSPARLKKLKEMGFRTILNLRGAQPGKAYYELEHHACRELGLKVIDLRWGSREAPFADNIEHLARVFAAIEYPAFMHCKSGADRAGIAAALFKLLHERASVEAAMEQLSLKYGHVRQGKTGMLDHFLELYRERNTREPIDFLTWVRTEYDRSACQDGFHASWWGSALTEVVLRRE